MPPKFIGPKTAFLRQKQPTDLHCLSFFWGRPMDNGHRGGKEKQRNDIYTLAAALIDTYLLPICVCFVVFSP
jgi:hypothetical protein